MGSMENLTELKRVTFKTRIALDGKFRAGQTQIHRLRKVMLKLQNVITSASFDGFSAAGYRKHSVLNRDQSGLLGRSETNHRNRSSDPVVRVFAFV